MASSSDVDVVTELIEPPHPVNEAVSHAEVLEGLRKQAKSRLAVRFLGRASGELDEWAGDIVQCTCLRALEIRDKYDPSRSIKAWLHGVLVMVFKEQSRKMFRQPFTITDAFEIVEPAPEADTDTYDIIHQHLELLGEADRQLISWFYFEDLSHQEIADHLGITAVNSRVRLNRAMTGMRRMIGQFAGQEGNHAPS